MSGFDGRSAFIGKVVPSAPAPYLIERPRVMSYLASVAQRRVTALTAGPGFGKSTALADWAADRNCAWYTVTQVDRDPPTLAQGLLASLALRVPGLLDDLSPALDGARGLEPLGGSFADVFVPALAGALHGRLTSDLVLILDDVDELYGHEQALRLVVELCHMAPRRLHLVLVSRTDLPFPVGRLRSQGQLLVLAADSLRFDIRETESLLSGVGGPALSARTDAVQQLTGGWPAAVRLVAETLATAIDADKVLAGFVRREGALALVADLLSADISAAPAGRVALLRMGAALEAFTAHMLEALGLPEAVDVLAAAERRGVHIAPAANDGWFTLTPLSRQYLLTQLTNPAESAAIRIQAAKWHRQRGDQATALRYLCAAGDTAGLVDLLTSDGSALLAGGHGATVRDALGQIPPALRTPAIDLVEGEACYVHGDWDRAAACLSRLVPPDGRAPAAAAWRLGLIHHMRGEPARALTLYRRGYADPAGSVADRALAAAWGSAAAWLTGEVAACRELADAASRLAELIGDDRALAAAHTARAMLAALDGDRRNNDMHYLRALDHATRAGDALQIIRIRANRGSHFLEEGYYAEALAELDTSIGLAELAGFASIRALALANRGEAARRLGRLEDAARDFHAALAQQQRLDSRMASYALRGLGAVHADQGNDSLARAAFEEAVALAEPSGDLQGLVPALCGLARTIVHDDPDLASVLVSRARTSGANLAQTQVLLAAGWVALRRRDAAAARECALAANDSARRRRDRPAVAESLELRAAALTEAGPRLELLREAEALWEALGCPLPLARTRLALIELVGQDAAGLSLNDIERVCREVGARGLAAQAARARDRPTSDAPGLSVATLGGFRVLRHGLPIPLRAWQSRKARDLLKILVARRGIPVARDVLCDLLWPDADPARASGRLSVAISTLRSVLDPGHDLPADHYVASGEGVVSLHREHVDVDVESFLQMANAGLAGDMVALSAAEAAYPGDFCEEDRYAEWAQALREEARAAYVAVIRTLALRRCASGDHETAVRYLLRLVACEPYDEPAHLGLVRQLDAAGRHGDARRMYRTYSARMAELDLDPAPYPDKAVTARDAVDRCATDQVPAPITPPAQPRPASSARRRRIAR